MRISRNKGTVAAATMREGLERFREFLHERSLRTTGVREAIVKAALARKGHFLIDELAEDLRSEGVSKATVYRAMPLLIEAGIVQPTVLSGEKHRYEAAFGHEHHDHLICSRCGEVVEFQFEAFEILQRELAAKHGYRLTAHFHELIGICSACQAKQAALRN
jgi:Fur family transcriptional regulator, ferric uptake regulator